VREVLKRPNHSRTTPRNTSAGSGKNFVEDCQATLSFVGLYNFIATKVEVFNEDTQSYETFNLLDDDSELELTGEQEKLDDQGIENISLMLYIKERLNISDMAWHELSMKLTEMPNVYLIKKRIKSLNGMWNITETPGEVQGVTNKGHRLSYDTDSMLTERRIR